MQTPGDGTRSYAKALFRFRCRTKVNIGPPNQSNAAWVFVPAVRTRLVRCQTPSRICLRPFVSTVSSIPKPHNNHDPCNAWATSVGCCVAWKLRLATQLAYLAENSSKVSSSCPALLLGTLVLNADLAHPDCTCEAIKGACRKDLKTGLKTVETGARAARRNIEVEAIVRRCRRLRELLPCKDGGVVRGLRAVSSKLSLASIRRKGSR
jgi:hypothetical protein